MRAILSFMALVLGLWMAPAIAQEPVPSTVGQVKLDLLKQLESDGYLSATLRAEATAKYVKPAELQMPLAEPARATELQGRSLQERHWSWVGGFKALGVLVLFVSVCTFIFYAMPSLLTGPKEVYQALFLALGGVLTLRPELLWPHQPYFLALFGAFFTLLILRWVLLTHPRLMDALNKVFDLGVAPMWVASFLGMLYFGGLALHYQSQIFGFAAAVCLSGVLSFSLYYRQHLLNFSLPPTGVHAVALAHLLVLGGYLVAKVTGQLPAQASLFAVGLEYFCTIVMGIAFMRCATTDSGHFNATTLSYLALFAVVAFAAIAGYHLFDLKVVSSVIVVFGALTALQWIGHLCLKMGLAMGVISGTALLGSALYGGAFLVERYGHLIVQKLA